MQLQDVRVLDELQDGNLPFHLPERASGWPEGHRPTAHPIRSNAAFLGWGDGALGMLAVYLAPHGMLTSTTSSPCYTCRTLGPSAHMASSGQEHAPFHRLPGLPVSKSQGLCACHPHQPPHAGLAVMGPPRPQWAQVRTNHRPSLSPHSGCPQCLPSTAAAAALAHPEEPWPCCPYLHQHGLTELLTIDDLNGNFLTGDAVDAQLH